MSEVQTLAPVNTNRSASAVWLRALELTAPISRNRDRTMPVVIDELANRFHDALALLSDRECLTYRELAERANQYARWALQEGLAKGDVVGLLMTNRPEYFALWLGITKIGGVVALLNTNLCGPSLAHCINITKPKYLIAAAELVDPLTSALPGLKVHPAIWTHGAEHPPFRRIELALDRLSGERLAEGKRSLPSIDDRALYIFTSGTTGLPKAASVSHARIMQWSHWFAGMMNAQPEDRMYNSLPMYHSVGGVLAIGAVLVAGGSVVIREKFSANQFWNDIVRWDCTLFQYIGEFCRYLLYAKTSSNDLNHRIRLACGNGMAADVWDEFKNRFGLPQVLEFYASTEGGVSLFNVEEKRGAIGHVPGYLAHRLSPPLVQFDIERGEPVRNEQGFCVPCASNQVGEALGRLVDDPSSAGSRFEGYTDEQASEEKILRDVFAPGDAWVRTGDLMRKDEKGFFYFVDRIGDTFRWKGENVATSEVSDAIREFPGVRHANVYGVQVPAAEGRACMAALVTENGIDLSALRKYLAGRLPAYARPLFLRLQAEMEVTGTFKYSKTDLARQGYRPGASSDALYFDDPESKAFIRLDNSIYDRIQAGQIRL